MMLCTLAMTALLQTINLQIYRNIYNTIQPPNSCRGYGRKRLPSTLRDQGSKGASTLLVLRTFYGRRHIIHMHLQSVQLPTRKWTQKMGMDRHFHGRTLVPRLLGPHSICPISRRLPLHLQRQALPQVKPTP